MSKQTTTKPFYNSTIPSDWEVKKLGTLVEIVSGVSPSLFNLDVVGKYPYLKVEDLNNCEKYQTESREYSNDEKCLVQKHSVIFPKRGAAILNNKVRINSVAVQMDSNLMAVYPKVNNLSHEYLYYQITFEQLYKIADTSTIPQINNKHIIPYSFPLPPLPEQKAIAHILSLMDTYINKNNQLIAKKELQKKWLMQNLLNGKKRLKGFKKGKWLELRLGDIAVFLNGKAYNQDELLSNGKYKVLRVGNFFTNANWYYSDLELEEAKYVSDGDLMYAWSASFGPRFWIGDKTIYHYHIWKVVPYEIITKQFLYFFLAFDTDKIFNNKQGGTMFHITKGDMEKRKIILPTLPEQTAIAQVLQAADKEIQLLKAKVELLKQQKKGMMQVLLTGKKRLTIKN